MVVTYLNISHLQRENKSVFSNASATPLLMPYGVRFAKDLIFSPKTTGSDSLPSAVRAAVHHTAGERSGAEGAGAGEGEGEGIGATSEVEEGVAVAVAGWIDTSTSPSAGGSICDRNLDTAVLIALRTRGTRI